MKTLLALFLLIPTLVSGEIIDAKYCSILSDRIKDDIGNYYSYDKNISDFNKSLNQPISKEQYQILLDLRTTTIKMRDDASERIITKRS